MARSFSVSRKVCLVKRWRGVIYEVVPDFQAHAELTRLASSSSLKSGLNEFQNGNTSTRRVIKFVIVSEAP